MIKRSMTAEPEKIPFQKLTSDEARDLLEEMRLSPPEIVASLPQQNPHRYRVRKVDTAPPKVFLADADSLSPSAEYLLNFGVKSGVYFLKTRGQKNSFGFYLDFSGDIFKIQRRENFRCPIPSGVTSSVKIYTSDNAPLVGNYTLRDISGQGVAISLPKEADPKVWQKSTEIRLDLQILNLSLKQMKAIVRHVHPGPSAWAGLEFPEINFSQETDLSALSLELQRILFQVHSER